MADLSALLLILSSANDRQDKRAAIYPAAQKNAFSREPFEPEMLHVSAGDFWMGSRDTDKHARENEKPHHLVYLDEFWVGKYPVTVAQFRVFIEHGGYVTVAERQVGDETWRTPRGKGSSIVSRMSHPVTAVSWEDAVEFCAWLARVTGRPYRLPVEAEWEKAARGLDGRVYPWGNTPPERLQCNTHMWCEDTTPVEQFSPAGDSFYGCASMAGNVWEWCADWWEEGYYALSPRNNPAGPAEGEARVLRGGSWHSGEESIRCACRIHHYPHFTNNTVGFRVAASQY